MLKTVLLAMPVLATFAADPASAQAGAWKVGNYSYHLYYADLDMNSVGGRKAMLARVQRTAERLCRDLERDRDCVTLAVAETLSRTSDPKVRLALAERDTTRLAAR